MKRALTSNTGDHSSLSLLNQLAKGLEPDSGQETLEKDTKEIDRELVKWAGRLELESIDLREKSKGLLGLLKSNSDSLSKTSSKLNKDFDSFKKSHFTKLQNVISSVDKTRNSIECIQERFDSEMLQIQQRQTVKPVTEKNINKLLQLVKTLDSKFVNYQQNQQETQKRIRNLDSILNDSISKLDVIHNMQIDLNNELCLVKKSQELLKIEIHEKNSNSISETYNSQHCLLPTPTSSFSESIQNRRTTKRKKSIVRRVQLLSNRKSSHSHRQLLRLQRQVNDTTDEFEDDNEDNYQFISLLSDDSLLPAI